MSHYQHLQNKETDIHCSHSNDAAKVKQIKSKHLFKLKHHGALPLIEMDRDCKAERDILRSSKQVFVEEQGMSIELE